MTKKIRKAIMPVAGLGTRFLPATKAQPKEMLTLVDKPVIQYIVEEAVASGIEEIVFVTSQSKRAIEDHFDRNFELENRLKEKNKQKELEEVLKLSDLAKFAFVRQKEAKGNGHAILQALPFIDAHEPVAVLFGDDVIDSTKPCLKQLIEAYEKLDAPIMAVEEVPASQAQNYGVIGGPKVAERTYQVELMVEKPKPEEAPSNLTVVGRYIFTPELCELFKQTPPSANGEIEVTTTLQMFLKKNPIYAYQFTGDRYDCGNKLQFLIATMKLGQKHPEVGEMFRKFLERK